MKLVREAPETAVLEAWRQLENSLHEYAQKVHTDVAPATWTMPLVLAAILLNSGKLTDAQYKTITGLKQLRDKLTHAMQSEVSVGEAIEYVDLALWLMSTLD